MPPRYKGATEQEFQAWEKLVDEGVPAYEAAHQIGTTLSALSRGDDVRKQQGMALAKERQAAKVERVIGEQAARPEPSPAIVNAWAKANHPDYADKVTHEHVGRVEHEHRGEFTFAAIVARAKQLGVLEQLGLDRPEEPVPAARSLPAGPAGAAE